MITISILYPSAPGARFDMDYYLSTHMPMAVACLGGHPGYLGVSVSRGEATLPSGSPAAFVAICEFRFASREAFMEAFAPHAERLQGDLPNYTDILPLIQAGQVVL
ncbi:EthD family reductase [Paludibacterium paludis]|uniref:EthD domain-containing protein n=1 Tax=Paludibacterium paludis TaxID=1225769 RepID=A0A918P6L5_9NEIS|nr:EthD family reductase [Paludibacterium paludis]GGY26662.1 hypothetical protein GCM10011289_32780 [Paludibacterium paludis]